MNCLAIFDFDHTITSKDSFIDFIVYAVGKKRFLLGLCFLSPFLLAYKLGFIKNSRAKETVFSYFFKGWEIAHFEQVTSQYSAHRLPTIVRQIAMERMNWHKSQGHMIIVVSASLEDWLKGWCRVNNLELVATKCEVKERRITGRLSTKNCYGEEKVRRLREEYQIEEFNYIYAYGDSRGDKEIISIANEKYYRWKRVDD